MKNKQTRKKWVALFVNRNVSIVLKPEKSIYSCSKSWPNTQIKRTSNFVLNGKGNFNSYLWIYWLYFLHFVNYLYFLPFVDYEFKFLDFFYPKWISFEFKIVPTLYPPISGSTRFYSEYYLGVKNLPIKC